MFISKAVLNVLQMRSLASLLGNYNFAIEIANSLSIVNML